MKLHKNCEGCNLNFIKYRCLIKYDHDLISKCPCRNCLVKMVCETICEDRVKLYESFSKSTRDRLSKKNTLHLSKRHKGCK